MVYEKAPDFTRPGQPEMGARQACGVIKPQAPGALGRLEEPEAAPESH